MASPGAQHEVQVHSGSANNTLSDGSVIALCRLYVNVITTIKGYGEFLWVDVVEQIDSMTEQVNGFQAQCKKLPKVIRCQGVLYAHTFPDQASDHFSGSYSSGSSCVT